MLAWRIDVSVEGVLKPFTDAHGNLAHVFYADGAVSELVLHVSGEVITTDTTGIVSGTPEPLPKAIYLRTTPLTEADAAIRTLAKSCRDPDPVAEAHRLMLAVHERVAFDPDVTHPSTDAATAFRLGRGVCQDLAQILIAAARHLGRPARYVSGHYAPPDHPEQEAAHAWAELALPGLGWVAFDPTHGVCAGEAHVRVAVGFDSADAAPIRGARRGGGAETLQVSVHGRAVASDPPGVPPSVPSAEATQ